MRRALLVAATLLAGCGGGGEEQRRDAGPPPRPPSDPEHPERHLEALQRIADRSGGTRAAGTEGDRRTVDYIARTLRAAGWSVTLQPVRFPYFEERVPPRLGALRPERELVTARYSGSGDVRAPAGRARGRGCAAADYRGLRGAIALATRGRCFFSVKARAAERAGAAGLVIVDVHGATPVSATLLRPGIAIPVVVVTRRAAERIDGRTVALRVDADSELRRTTNVIAETAAPVGPWTMAGGHHDSVSAGPGINDNGSGVAALLAIAQRLRDVRGLRLGFWGAEELALYGSRAYVRELTSAERANIGAYVNVDMLGSPNGSVAVYDRDDRIERELRRALRGREREVRLEGASDHAPFERAAIPVGGVYTGSTERGRRPGPADRCYHRTCDTLDNVDRRLLGRTTDGLERALVRLAR